MGQSLLGIMAGFLCVSDIICTAQLGVAAVLRVLAGNRSWQRSAAEGFGLLASRLEAAGRGVPRSHVGLRIHILWAIHCACKPCSS